MEHLSPAQREHLTRVLEDYRAWAAGETQPPTATALLPGGYSNSAILLEGLKGRWVLRLGVSPAPPGVSRERELALQQLAAGAGLAPSVCYAKPEQGVLIMNYVEGRQERATQTGLLAAYFLELHSLTAPGEAMHSPDVLRRYASLEQPGGGSAKRPGEAPFPMFVADPLKAVVDTALGIVEAIPRGDQLCHNDLLSANRIRRGDRLIGLDWEYATPGNPFFDLAVCASELDSQHASLLLRHYLDRNPDRDERRHLQAQLIIYRLIETVWFMRFAPHTTAARIARRKSDTVLALAAQTPGFL